MKTVESECKFMEIDKAQILACAAHFSSLSERGRDYHRRLMDFNKTFPTENLSFAQNADFYRFIHVT